MKSSVSQVPSGHRQDLRGQFPLGVIEGLGHRGQNRVQPVLRDQSMQPPLPHPGGLDVGDQVSGRVQRDTDVGHDQVADVVADHTPRDHLERRYHQAFGVDVGREGVHGSRGGSPHIRPMALGGGEGDQPPVPEDRAYEGHVGEMGPAPVGVVEGKYIAFLEPPFLVPEVLDDSLRAGLERPDMNRHVPGPLRHQLSLGVEQPSADVPHVDDEGQARVLEGADHLVHQADERAGEDREGDRIHLRRGLAHPGFRIHDPPPAPVMSRIRLR